MSKLQYMNVKKNVMRYHHIINIGSMLHYSIRVISLSADKLWAGPSQLDGAPWDGREYGIMGDRHENWNFKSDLDTKAVSNEMFAGKKTILPPQTRSESSLNNVVNHNELLPQARAGIDVSWDGSSNVWSAALGAMGGAGAVLIIAAFLFLFKKTKKQESPTLAPMGIGQNVSIYKLFLKITNFKEFIETYLRKLK